MKGQKKAQRFFDQARPPLAAPRRQLINFLQQGSADPKADGRLGLVHEPLVGPKSALGDTAFGDGHAPIVALLAGKRNTTPRTSRETQYQRLHFDANMHAIKEKRVPVRETPQERLGRLLRERRESLKREEPGRWTQTYLADVTGLAQTTISAWENGKVTRPNMGPLSKIVFALGLDVNDVLNEVGWPGAAEELAELQEARRALDGLTGTHLEIARLLPDVPPSDAPTVLSHIKWIIEQASREHRRTPESGGETGGAKKRGFTASQLANARVLLSPTPAMA